MDISSVQQNGKMGRSPSQKRCTSEQQNDSVPNRRCTTPVEHKHETAEDVEKAVAGSMVEESASISFKQLKFTEDSTKSDFPPGDGATGNNLIKLGQWTDDVSKNPGLEQLGQAQENGAKSPSQLGEISLTSSVSSTRQLPKKRKDTQRLSSGSTRLLRSRSQEKSKVPELSNNLAEEKGVDIEKKRKQKKKRTEKSQVNEFSRIRTHLRYLLHRITYEQNFIDAYSGEGWKGQSLEKIKPKRELQRAKSEIFRRKLKIRDLFQHLDLACAEGRIPEALFDSEGEIDSEDIFCAKCGSKDETINNDIILCDGTCERGFHQFCLEPPLLKEHIPPDDEGWLCPGCDCKVDCIDLINDAQGTDLSVIDSWEKVFPEEAAAAAGNKLDDNLGLPSDDSEDDDYDPDGPELDENEMVQSDESSSDESDNSSASDDLGALPNNEQTLGLPSDDSEDDDYDPSGLDPDQEVKQESSSSDFTSDSEDFSVAFGDDKPSGEVQGPTTKSNKERGGQNEAKRELINDELVSILESDSGRGDSGSIYPKRHIERLDYKKLHDEEYGNTSSDSSDEDYLDVDITSPKKRKSNSPKAASVSPNGETPIANHGKDSSNIEQNQIEIECTGKKRTRKKKIDVEGIPATQCKDSSAPGTSSIGTPKSREAVTQRLLESFKESQYPTRDVKENLARELPLTVQQISKWFENTRWSYRHSSHKKSKVDGITSNKNTSPQKTEKLSEPEPELVSRDDTSNGVEVKKPDVKPNMVKVEGNGEKSSTPKSRKRKAKFDNQETGPNTSTKEKAKQNAEVSSPKTQGGRKSSRLQSKSKKSVSRVFGF